MIDCFLSSFCGDIRFFNIYFFEVQLIYNVVLISAVQQSDSVVHIYILFHILFHYGLSQDIGYSPLCCTVGPCCLSILDIIVCICSSPDHPSPPQPLATTSLFSMGCKVLNEHLSSKLELYNSWMLLCYISPCYSGNFSVKTLKCHPQIQPHTPAIQKFLLKKYRQRNLTNKNYRLFLFAPQLY